MSNDINTLAVSDDPLAREFTRVLYETSAPDGGEVDVHMNTEPERMRWSFTYGGDCPLSNDMYKGLLLGFLNALRDVFTFVLTIEHPGTGEMHSFQCFRPEGGFKLQGADWSNGDCEPYITVSEYFPETNSVGVSTVKVYLHQIVNIHIP